MTSCTPYRWLPALMFLLLAAPPAASADAPPGSPEIISVKKIWDEAEHSAFTDLVRFQDRWYCTFREGAGHVRGDGKLRVLVSEDGEEWASVALLADDGVDLRDPKLSVTADGRLMILAGGSIYRDGNFVTNWSRVAFSKDGREWTELHKVLPEREWLWRVTWHEGRAWGFSYRTRVPDTQEWRLSLWSTEDGLEYERVKKFDITGRPSEATARFTDDGGMIALLRRDGEDRMTWIGTSRKPYTEWRWHTTDQRSFGGPDFIILPDGRMWAAGRGFPPEGTRTVLARMTPTSLEPVLTFPSGGDTSYPGLVWHDGLLWMSYYASHEDRSSIYLARIRIPTR